MRSRPTSAGPPVLGRAMCTAPVGVGFGCGTLGAAQLMTEVPISQDQAALEEARDKYLRTTRLGTYAIDVFYQNESYIRERIQGTALDDPTKDLARAFYGKYAGDAKLALADIDRRDLTLGEQHFTDAEVALRAARPHLRDDEYRAAEQLLALARVTLGKNPRECLEVLDDPTLYARVREIMSSVSTLETEVDPQRATQPGWLPDDSGG